MKRLIYFSPVPWASFAQRPQKFVEWFHSRTGSDVIWVDPYPTRFPRLADLRRQYPAKAPGGPENPDWIRILKPFALPLEPLPGSGWLNVFWRPILTELDRFAENNDTMLVIGKPSLLALAALKRLKNANSVYDAMDDFPAFYKGISRFSFARREERVVRKVNSLWVTSTRLKQRWSALRPDLELVKNALDESLLPEPAAPVNESRPKVFGYVGTIASWFDWQWIVALANARPKDVVRLIGPVFNPSQFPLPVNVEILPECHHKEALIAMRYFDVGLIPFIRNDLTESVDPIKYYEYRALGLPVISTKFGEMEFRAHEAGTFICNSSKDIEPLAELAVEFRDDCAAAKEFAAKNSWATRFNSAKLLP